MLSPREKLKVCLFGSKIALVGLYSPPGNAQELYDTFTHLFIRNELDKGSWVTMGDFNQPPRESAFADFVSQFSSLIHTDGQPTRWEGEACLDWFFSSRRAPFQWHGQGRVSSCQ